MKNKDNTRERTELVDLWRQLAPAERVSLLQFARFLRAQQGPSRPPIPTAPLAIPRPEGESAVKALKRLKQTYPMIDADGGLLDDASRLLMEKICGVPDPEVIEKLEALFLERYQTWQKNHTIVLAE